MSITKTPKHNFTNTSLFYIQLLSQESQHYKYFTIMVSETLNHNYHIFTNVFPQNYTNRPLQNCYDRCYNHTLLYNQPITIFCTHSRYNLFLMYLMHIICILFSLQAAAIFNSAFGSFLVSLIQQRDDKGRRKETNKRRKK